MSETCNASKNPAPAWHAESTDAALQRLSVSAGAGLTRAEVSRRLAQYGLNVLPAAKRRAPWLRLLL